MLQINVSLKFSFGAERHITLGFASSVRTDEVRLGEMDLQVGVFFIVHVLVFVTAQRTRQVQFRQVVEELQVIEQELFTEVAVRVRQNISVCLISYISKLNVLTQSLHVVNALLSDEDCASLETNFAESFTVNLLKMALQ
jgi:hypothetical protein